MVEELSFLNKEEVSFYKMLEEKVLISNRRNSYEETDFLDPFWQKMLISIVNKYDGVSVSFFGAFNNAERCVGVIYNDYLPVPIEDEYMSVLAFDSKFDDVKHKDVLGKLMSMGIERETVGDIIFYKDACFFSVKKSVESFLLSQFQDIRRHSVSLYSVDGEGLKVVESEKTTEVIIAASLRADLLVAKIYNIKRNIATSMISKGLMKLDYRVFTRGDRQIELPALISLRGYGRVYVDEVVGRTGSDNLKVKLRREVYS